MAADRRRSLWALAATLAVAAGLAAAFVHLGPPSERRLRKLDQERVSRLQRLRNDIETHVEKERTLPGDLATLANKPWAERVALDPESQVPFGYEVTGPWAYRLCADFARPSAPPPSDQRPGFWDHPQGKYCFEIEVEQPAAAAGTGQ